MKPHGGKAYNTPLLYEDSAWGLRVQRRLEDAEGDEAPDGVFHDVLQGGTHGENIQKHLPYLSGCHRQVRRQDPSYF